METIFNFLCTESLVKRDYKIISISRNFQIEPRRSFLSQYIYFSDWSLRTNNFSLALKGSKSFSDIAKMHFIDLVESMNPYEYMLIVLWLHNSHILSLRTMYKMRYRLHRDYKQVI